MISGRTNEMALTKEVYQTYVDILKEELKPAFGCTEPIALAYCASCEGCPRVSSREAVH